MAILILSIYPQRRDWPYHKGECRGISAVHPHTPTPLMRLVVRAIQKKKEQENSSQVRPFTPSIIPRGLIQMKYLVARKEGKHTICIAMFYCYCPTYVPLLDGQCEIDSLCSRKSEYRLLLMYLSDNMMV